MNHQDKQLTSFLGMTIGSALDDYMANLAKLSVKIQQDAEKKAYQLEKELKDIKAKMALWWLKQYPLK
jgi:hypothetical protein